MFLPILFLSYMSVEHVGQVVKVFFQVKGLLLKSWLVHYVVSLNKTLSALASVDSVK